MGTLDATLTATVAMPTANNCQNLVQRWETGGSWDAGDVNDRLLAPTGGLRGDAIIIDVAAGTAFSYPALGFTGLSQAPRHSHPLSPQPRLHEIQPAAGADIEVTLVDAKGDAVTLTYPATRGRDALATLLTATSGCSVPSTSRLNWLRDRLGHRVSAAPRLHDDAPGGMLPRGTPPQAPLSSRSCEFARLRRKRRCGNWQGSGADSASC